MPDVNWAELRAAASEAAGRAYAPYSSFPVGAAAVTDADRVLTGCNVENASYGLALCAECGLVSSLVSGGGGRLVAVTCVGGEQRRRIMPCGRCRQLLWEHGGPELLVDTPAGPLRLDKLLPVPFDGSDLEMDA